MDSHSKLESKLEKWIIFLICVCITFILFGIAVGVYGLRSFDMSLGDGIESFGNYASDNMITKSRKHQFEVL